jgi:hypothetical protein
MVLLCTVLVVSLPGALFVPSAPSDCAYAQPAGAPAGPGVVPPAGEKPAPPPGEQPLAPAPAPARTTNTIVIVAVVVAIVAIIVALALRNKPQ